MTDNTQHPDPHEDLRVLINQIEGHLKAQRDLFGERAFVAKSTVKKKESPVQIEPEPPVQLKSQAKVPVRAAANVPVVPSTVVSAAPVSDEPWVKADSLISLNDQICNCLKCPLGKTRTKFVFGVGNPNADIMFIGEGPGADEDRIGEPFVGRAGQLLTKIMEAIQLKREEVYIANIVKCRPPENRVPLPEEMEMCTPYLLRQIALVRPKFIVALGRTSAQYLLKTTSSLSAMREQVHEYQGAKLIVTFHPAALLRNPNWKRPTWEDMKKLRSLYDESKA